MGEPRAHVSEGSDPEDAYTFGAMDARRLLEWHRGHRRDFPWRAETDPYRLVVTELMLVRTRADQVAKVWPSFFQAYPTLEALGRAPEDQVSESLRPLGLEWRSTRIVSFASAALRDKDWVGRLSALPGVGPYVSASVSLALNGRGRLPVDVTIARVIARYWGLHPAGEARRDQGVLRASAAMGQRSRHFFYASLDLAAAVCRPHNPDCEHCPLRQCVYRRNDLAMSARSGQCR
jgi:A/G-specific adenine glycosylase